MRVQGLQRFWDKIIGGKLNKGVYYHITAILDLKNTNIRLYVNGTIKSQRIWKDLDASSASRAFWNSKLLIGIGEPREEIKPRALIGFIDELRIYNRALTDGEVNKIFSGEKD